MKQKIYKTIKKRKNNQKSKKQAKTRKGGSTPQCNILDTQYNKQNPTWDTCITIDNKKNNIVYITSSNVIIKSIESAQIPEFMVKLLPAEQIKTKIMIEDKYVGCFIRISNQWYVMMRLFGKTLNTGYLARTEKNKVFYKLKSGITFDIDTTDTNKGSGLIQIAPDSYTKEDKKQIVATSNAPTIILKNEFVENINKSNNLPIFNILQRFRQQKLLGNDVKQVVAQEAADGVVNGLLSWFSS